MEYIVEKTEKVKKLNEEDKLSVASKIAQDYDTYNKGRMSQLDKAKLVSDEIFMKNELKQSKEPDKSWKSTLKTRKIYMYSQILKAFIWKNTYANTNSMFDVSGENLESNSESNKQKTMLVDCMEKMEYSKTLDKIIDNSLIYGELISFTTWRKKSEEFRRPIDFFQGVKEPNKLKKMLAAKMRGDTFFTDERTIYDNPYTYSVDPVNFVFDPAQFEDFDSCPKIHRTWKTPEAIISNKYFEITDEIKENLRTLVKGGTDEGDASDQSAFSLNEDKRVNGSTVEMLEFWGDLTLPSGQVLKNWYAVVVAGKYLVRFEKNPLVINPFTFGAYCVDPATKRGISVLYSIYKLAMTQEAMLRKTSDLQALNENKPTFVGKDFLGKNPGDIELHPGKVIEYDPQMYTTLPIQPMEFPDGVYDKTVAFLDDIMSEISGIFPNMAGVSENDRTTATEVSTKVEGQLTRLKMLLDIINQNLILSNVKIIAKLKANFTFGEEQVFIDNDNEPRNVVIDDNVRQADYRYTYADRSATSERFNYVDMVAQAIQMFVKSGLQVNTQEVFIWYMEQKGVENPERFVNNLNIIAPEVQQALMQNPQLAPVIQEMQNRVEMAKEGKELPPEEEGTPGMEMPEQAAPEPELNERLGNLPGRNLLSD